MKQFRSILMAIVCGAFLCVCLTGCSSDGVKQEAGSGGKGLTADEKKAKQGKE